MSSLIEYIGKDDLTERELFLLSLETSIKIPEVIQLPSKHFACFIVWDSKSNSIQQISDLAATLIKNGAAYICVWGNDCQRVEDICDEIGSFNSPDDSVIMTTSHKNDPLEEALYFFLTDTHPDEYYEPTLSSSLAVLIDNQNNLQIIKDALLNPNQFRKYILDKEK